MSVKYHRRLLNAKMAEWSIAADCKSAGRKAYVGSNPALGTSKMDISEFDYFLPKELIANTPAKPRDSSRLMIIDRKTGKITEHIFRDIYKILGKNDVLVLNKTKVFPARLFVNKVTGGKVELLFLEEVRPKIWKCLTHPGLKIGTQVSIKRHLFDVIGQEEMTALIDTHLEKEKLMTLLKTFGHTPIPPYIKPSENELDLRKEYQTVYADKVGSVAAPTAGFHFTKSLLNKLKANGVQIEYVTLHVGLGTFAPVKTQNIEDHPMHSEEYFIDKNTAERLNKAKKQGKRIVAVGTTSVRTLESAFSAAIDRDGPCQLDPEKLRGSTEIFIYPGYKFKYIDALITNFHLPKSTLIALVSAFVSFPNTNKKFKNFQNSLMGKAYAEAIKEKYRFYSFGDACLIT